MKKLLLILVLATLSAGLVSCKQEKVKLHESVGDVYLPEGFDKGTETMAGDGIIFHVNEAEGYAYVCSMTDLKYTSQNLSTIRPNVEVLWNTGFTWSVFGSDTVMERDTVWANVYRSIRQNPVESSTEYVVKGSIMPEVKEYIKKKYDFQMGEPELIMIYPMLRYKTRTEKGEPVHPTITVPSDFLGFRGANLSLNDTVLKEVKAEKFVNTHDESKPWTDASVYVGGTQYNLALNGEPIINRDGLIETAIYRPYADTVERRTRTFELFSFSGYVDTVKTYVKKGDRMKLGSDNKGEYRLDTNWSCSLIPGLGENDADGKVNTMKIVNADVPCGQQITPDSSSAARTCYEYFTRAYTEKDRGGKIFKADTMFKAPTYANEDGRWYLPSREELKWLFNAKDKINEKNANTLGFEPLQNCYWSSNQRGPRNAWYKCFTDNGVESYIPKANTNYRLGIRAVRKVKWPLK